MVSEVTSSVLRCQEVCGVQDHQVVVNFFNLMVVLPSIKQLQEMCIRCYFRRLEKTKAEDIRERSVLGKPHKLLLGYKESSSEIRKMRIIPKM